jgi:hypothetical protein
MQVMEDLFKPGKKVTFELAVMEAPLSTAKTYDWPGDVISVNGDQVGVRYEWRGKEMLRVFHRRQLRVPA